jgi:hypothetical protein
LAAFYEEYGKNRECAAFIDYIRNNYEGQVSAWIRSLVLGDEPWAFWIPTGTQAAESYHSHLKGAELRGVSRLYARRVSWLLTRLHTDLAERVRTRRLAMVVGVVPQRATWKAAAAAAAGVAAAAGADAAVAPPAAAVPPPRARVAAPHASPLCAPKRRLEAAAEALDVLLKRARLLDDTSASGRADLAAHAFYLERAAREMEVRLNRSDVAAAPPVLEQAADAMPGSEHSRLRVASRFERGGRGGTRRPPPREPEVAVPHLGGIRTKRVRAAKPAKARRRSTDAIVAASAAAEEAFDRRLEKVNTRLAPRVQAAAAPPVALRSRGGPRPRGAAAGIASAASRPQPPASDAGATPASPAAGAPR